VRWNRFLYLLTYSHLPVAENLPDRTAWYRRNARMVLLFSVIALGIILAMFPLLRWQVLCVGLVLGVLVILYLIPVSIFGGRLKEIGWLKSLLILSIWVIGSVWLPALQVGVYDRRIGWLTFYRLLFMAPFVLLIDWPDVRGDKRQGIRTVASMFVPDRFRQIISGLTVGALGALLVAVGYGGLPVVMLAESMPLGYLAVRVYTGLPESVLFYKLELDVIIGIAGLLDMLGAWFMSHLMPRI